MVHRLRADLKATTRTLFAAPGIPVATVMTVAVAVGINLAMLGLIDRALLSPPAHVAEPRRVFTLVFEQASSPDGPPVFGATTSFPTFETIRDRVPGIKAAAWHAIQANARIDDERVPVKAMAVSGDYFEMLAVRPYLGRVITPDDDRAPAGSPVVVLSHALWKRAFGDVDNVIGRTMSLNGSGRDVVRVIGVMPAGFSGHSADRVDLWLPLRAAAFRDLPGWERERSLAILAVGVRLTAGSTRESAAAQLTAVTGARTMLMPIIGAAIAPEPHRIAYWLAAVSMVVFVIGLANAATLLLVRGARRRREYSIRSALGATRRQLVSQIVVEAAILAIASGCAALALAYWFDELVRRLLMPSLIESTGLNLHIVAAALAGGVCTFMVAIVVGGWQIPGQISPTDLKDSRRLWRRATAQKELLIAQTTLAVLLIAGAGLFGRSYYNLLHRDLGMRTADVLVVSFAPGTSVPDQDLLFTSAAERVRALPGVASATVFGALPHSGIMVPPISVPGHAMPPTLDGMLPFMFESTPAYFEILGIPIVSGRAFTAADETGAPVAIVNETMARAIWPGTSALGKCFRIGFDTTLKPPTAGPPMPPSSAPCREIVGIARDVSGGFSESDRNRIMQYYVPWTQAPTPPHPPAPFARANGLLVRMAPGGDLDEASIRHIVEHGQTDLPMLDVRPYAALMAPEMAPWQIGTRLLLLFGSLALSIAAMGIYAAFAHAVAERRHEMAVRIAIGASQARVRLMMLRESLAVAVMGILYGSIAAAIAGRVVRSMFVGTSSTDPLVLGSAGAVMLIVAVLATWLPAFAASRADPNSLLRSE